MPFLHNLRTSDRYMLCCLHGTYYLIPTGQDVATHRSAIKLNDTGVAIWDAVSSDASVEALPSIIRQQLTARGFDMSSVTDEELGNDADSFIHSLIRHNALVIADDSRLPSDNSPVADAAIDTADACYRIGGLTIIFNGCTDCLDASLQDFRLDKDSAVSDISQIWQLRPLIAMPEFEGRMIIHTSQLELFDAGECYVMTFPGNAHLLLCRVTKDGRIAEFFYDHIDAPEARTELFYGLRNAFLIAAQQHGLFALHSASVLYNGRALLFCGQSGTGKSTHTSFWHELFGTPYLNGDLNLVGLEAGEDNKDNADNENNEDNEDNEDSRLEAYVYGIPWCGTSGIYTTQRVRLGAITLLRQASSDYVSQPEADSAQLLVAQRMISPTWTKELAGMNLDFAGKLQSHCSIQCLSCTARPEAAHVMKKYIDTMSWNIQGRN